MIKSLAVLFWLVLATSAQAQTVPIRSGEHDGFTRFVLDIPQGTMWTLDNRDTGADLSFKVDSLKVDATDAFDRISLDRVSSITQTGKTVSFAFACDCKADAYVLRNRMLVVDVSPAPKPKKPEQPVVEQTAGRAVVSDFQFGELLWRDRTTVPPFREGNEDRQGAKIVEDTPAADNLPPSVVLREQMKKQIAHAATIGLLQPEQVEVEPAKIDRLDPKTAPRPVPKTPAPSANMVFRNSTTVDAEGAPASLVDAMASIICPDPGDLNIASWGDDASFDDQISSLRADLFGEFDRTSSDIAIELAKTYIFFGFGQEALQSLEMVDPETPSIDTLRALAEIMERGQVTSVDPFSSFANCDGPIALWAVLASKNPKADMDQNRNSILAALDALPPHLREYLGPVLARRATMSGAVEVADRALRIAERTTPDPTSEHMLASAELDVKSQKPDTAIDTLTDIVETNTGVSPQAVIQLIETNFQQGSGVTESTVELAEALAVEMAETDLGPKLRRSQTIARAQLGDFDAAFRNLGLLAAQDAPDLVQSTKRDILGLLTKNASDADFVLYAFEPATGSSISDFELIRAVSARFAGLGFTDIAKDGIGLIPAVKHTREDKVLLSTIALKDRKPREALAYIAGLSDPAAETLRAQAMEHLGDHRSAAALFASANQSEASERSAWMAEDWEALTASETSQFKNAALALSAQSDETPGAGMIENGETLLEEASNLRSSLKAIVQTGTSN